MRILPSSIWYGIHYISAMKQLLFGAIFLFLAQTVTAQSLLNLRTLDLELHLEDPEGNTIFFDSLRYDHKRLSMVYTFSNDLSRKRADLRFEKKDIGLTFDVYVYTAVQDFIFTLDLTNIKRKGKTELVVAHTFTIYPLTEGREAVYNTSIGIYRVTENTSQRATEGFCLSRISGGYALEEAWKEETAMEDEMDDILKIIPSVRLRGNVSDTSGAAMPGVQIDLLVDGEYHLTYETNDEGKFNLPDMLLNHDYQLWFKAGGKMKKGFLLAKGDAEDADWGGGVVLEMNVEMLPERECSLVFFEETPVARASFRSDLQVIEWDMEYIERMKKMLHERLSSDDCK